MFEERSQLTGIGPAPHSSNDGSMMFSGRSRSASSIMAWKVRPIIFEGEAHANEVCEFCQLMAALICEPRPPAVAADLRWLQRYSPSLSTVNVKSSGSDVLWHGWKNVQVPLAAYHPNMWRRV